MLRTTVVSSAEDLDGLKDAWQDLARSSETATPFQTWEWQSTWWKHFSGARRMNLMQVHEGTDLVGIMPLFRSAGPWKALRPMGLGVSDYLHPLCRTGYDESVSETVSARISDMGDVHLIDLHQVRETMPMARQSASTIIDQATCLVLDLPDSYDAYLGTLSKSLRYDVRKLDKSMFTDGRAKIVEAHGDEIPKALEQFFELHHKRWRKRGQPGAFVGGRTRRFHEDWAMLADRAGYLWLGILWVDGVPIGAIYAMALGDCCYYYQAGFDPARSSLSPGTLLVAHTIRRAIDEGKRRFDFMRGDEPYKRRWKPQHALKNYRLLSPAKGTLGRLGAAWNDAGSKVEMRLRARLEGRGLL